jgi:tRNA(Ile2) C34 agmatinyltransferase TiaS
MGNEQCLTCDGDLTLMGSLGQRVWFRCRDCGLEQFRIGVTIEDYTTDEQAG